MSRDEVAAVASGWIAAATASIEVLNKCSSRSPLDLETAGRTSHLAATAIRASTVLACFFGCEAASLRASPANADGGVPPHLDMFSRADALVRTLEAVARLTQSAAILLGEAALWTAEQRDKHINAPGTPVANTGAPSQALLASLPRTSAADSLVCPIVAFAIFEHELAASSSNRARIALWNGFKPAVAGSEQPGEGEGTSTHGTATVFDACTAALRRVSIGPALALSGRIGSLRAAKCIAASARAWIAQTLRETSPWCQHTGLDRSRLNTTHGRPVKPANGPAAARAIANGRVALELCSLCMTGECAVVSCRDSDAADAADAADAGDMLSVRPSLLGGNLPLVWLRGLLTTSRPRARGWSAASSAVALHASAASGRDGLSPLLGPVPEAAAMETFPSWAV